MPFVKLVGVTPTNLNFLIGYTLIKDETTQSYHWVLECQWNLIGHLMRPRAIFVDRELGLGGPIRAIFPNSVHLFTWQSLKTQLL